MFLIHTRKSDNKNVLRIENGSDPQNIISITPNDGGLIVAVAEERAVDSYNEEFECSINLENADSIALRDYLVKLFPLPEAKQ